MKASRLPDGVPRLRNLTKALVFAAVLWPAVAGAAGDDTRPYDEKLLRLSEILGAVHFLRELCGADEGQLWRQQMTTLIDAEGGTAARRVRFVNSFNKGYRSYRRTYQGCTSAARDQTARFLTEGAELAKSLAEPKP